jgi:hypothetical protein
VGAERAQFAGDLAFKKSGIFFQRGLDHPNQIEFAWKILVYAQPLFGSQALRARPILSTIGKI